MLAVMPAVSDIALAFDPVSRRCDVVVADGDLVLDATPRTPMLMSLGLDRRAEPDDALPDGVPDEAAPAHLDLRRGWAGDALDGAGRRTGSRLWLLNREKQTESTRARAETYAAQALQWLADERGFAPGVSASWLRRGVLLLEADAGNARVAVPLGGAA